MPFVNLPEWAAREIVTAAKLGQYTTALQGFAAQPADIAWPLTAGGDIDFDSLYGIVNLRTFWNIINAAEYESQPDSLQAAIDAAELAGGGCVFIPPDTALETTGVTVESSLVAIVGCGPSSVIKHASGASNPLITLGKNSATYSNLVVANLQLDGSASTNANGITAKRISGLTLKDILFTSIQGDGLVLTNDGTVGNSTSNVQGSNLTFTSSGSNDIFVDDVDGLQLDNVRTNASTSDSIYMENSNANSIIRDVNLSDIRIESPGAKGVNIVGQSGTASANWSRITLSNVVVVDPTGDGIQVGDASKIVQEVTIRDCTIHETIGADGFVVNASKGTLTNLTANGAAGDGLDVLDSVNVDVHGCDFRNAGENGIDASSIPASASVSIWDNNVLGFTTEGVAKPESVDSTSEFGNNLGEASKLIGGTVYRTIGVDNGATTGSPVTVWTYTIPANTLIKHGDGVHVSVSAVNSNTATSTITVLLGGVNVGSMQVTTDVVTWLNVRSYINSAGPDGALNVNTWSGGTASGNVATAGYGTVGTIDFTEDVNLTVTATSGTATSLQINYADVTFFSGVAA